MATSPIQTFNFKKLEPGIAPMRLVEISVQFKPAAAGTTVQIARGTLLGIVTASGLWTPYASGNSDGSQVPQGLCVYDISVDPSGNVTYTTTAGQSGNEFGVTDLSAPVAIGGYFYAADLTGLNAAAITNQPSWRAIGGVTTGILDIG